MESYINKLKDRYKEVFREMSMKGRSGSLGEIVKEIVKTVKSKGDESRIEKAEIRDAIIAFAAAGNPTIRKYKQKRLEVVFKKGNLRGDEQNG